ncbi:MULTISPECIES: SURF1 family protein [Microbacterium]|uniref:SURF1 family protein n=1 Tax=Microbacterium TaxID=33882 RepID=UPI002781B9A5|nr:MULTISPECIES: SURF1 family cytochrome oxidase biogenesis protein [Microbacterium]MDQ1083049.1 cytochrome oxidase assembly protein ShyY1 [Microbacterium sp. SORGH_AS_0344]MDQ1171680.1 cytochrome oxidase assembly protein ShyY1 [Microbacterium proteolyticum]
MTSTSATEPDPPQIFPPTLREVMLRPRWIALLAFSLVVAGVLAWLGQWQLGRAVDTSPPEPGMTEVVRPLAEVVQPGDYLPEPLVGQRVVVSGTWVASDFLVVSSRFNDDVEGYWVTGQLRVAGAAEPTSVAVATGWTPSLDQANAAAADLERQVQADPTAVVEVTGRLISDEGPSVPPAGADPQTLVRMSPAMLLGRWHDIDGVSVYRQYIASQTAIGPLDDIASPAPDERSRVNWLNIFYAAEWAVFAGFALYLWYRLARDAWEKEVEDLEDEQAEALAAGAARSRD